MTGRTDNSSAVVEGVQEGGRKGQGAGYRRQEGQNRVRVDSLKSLQGGFNTGQEFTDQGFLTSATHPTVTALAGFMRLVLPCAVCSVQYTV